MTCAVRAVGERLGLEPGQRVVLPAQVHDQLGGLLGPSPRIRNQVVSHGRPHASPTANGR